MDRIKALELEEQLKGKSIDGWTIEHLINQGKSAAVFLASKEQEKSAVKIFDDELIERYGDEVQLARIKRELTLVGHNHPNMVKLFGGGIDDITKNHYLVMEYLDGPNLKDCLQKIPTENIGSLIAQLADCARFLENLDLVHRDIKPENIAILENYSKLVLLDFGVLRPVGEPGITDDNGVQPFVGTLQYSSPEFLFREEEDSTLGWRALTFYQIGGVLHDLLMREELFADRSVPYSRLVLAVKDDVPTIHNKAVPSYLVDLAIVCLAKTPKVRTDILGWDDFSPPKADNTTAEAAKTRVTSRQAIAKAVQTDETNNDVDPSELQQTVIDTIKLKVRGIRASNSSSLPPVVVTRFENEVTITLGPNNNFSMPMKLSICYTINILSPNIGAIELFSSAYIGNPTQNAKPTKLFVGIFTENGITSILENSIYVAVEQAQNYGPNGVNRNIDLSILES
ncbi:serine/threonine protein kinase [Kiloniella sp.]|uniref:serine/threonine protein kinase n=1 Tax=Kiloniella sp. TaxID=1938587 RepID=UPI003A92F287